jgi:hypothetical protein
MLQGLKHLFLLGSFILLLQVSSGCNQAVTAQHYNFTARNDWQYAALSAPPRLMQQVVKENIRSPQWLGDPGRMLIVKIQESNQQKPLYLIDSHIQHKCPPRGCDPSLDPLCGSAGCAHFGYIQDGKSYRQIFSEYLKSSLPPGVPFLRVSKQLSSGLPCLEFAELPNAMADSLQIRRFCYNGNKYQEKGKFKESLPSN